MSAEAFVTLDELAALEQRAQVYDLTAGYWRAVALAEDWSDCATCGEEFWTSRPNDATCPECREDAL